MRKSTVLFLAAGAVVSMLSFSAMPANAVTLPMSAGATVAGHDGLVKNVGYWGYRRPYYGRYYRPYYGRRYYHRPYGYGYYGRRYYHRPYGYGYYGRRYYRPYRYYRY